MDIQKEAVREYLVDGIPYRALAKKYGVSRSTINKWVLVHQSIYDLPRCHKQVSYDLQQKKLGKKSKQIIKQEQSDLEKKIEVLEKTQMVINLMSFIWKVFKGGQRSTNAQQAVWQYGPSHDSEFTHLANNTNIQKGIVNWLQRVTNEEYNSAR